MVHVTNCPLNTPVRLFTGSVPPGSVEIGMITSEKEYMKKNAIETRAWLIQEAKKKALRLGGSVLYLKEDQKKHVSTF